MFERSTAWAEGVVVGTGVRDSDVMFKIRFNYKDLALPQVYQCQVNRSGVVSVHYFYER